MALWLNVIYNSMCDMSIFYAIICFELVILCLRCVICVNVHKSLFYHRMVCAALISSDSLEWERTQLWALTFKLIRKIIGGVDYKVIQHTAQDEFVQYRL